MDFLSSLKPYLPQDEIDALSSALDKPRVHGFYLNTNRISDEEVRALFPSIKPHPIVPHAYIYEDAVLPLGKSLFFDCGGCYIIDPASVLPPFLLNPREGERILDMCAAPGGKTSVLSFLLGKEGVVLANDASFLRAKELSSNVERLGLGNVMVTCSSSLLEDGGYEGLFDAVLLDAPCSGSAMFRKNDLAKSDWSLDKVHRCGEIQRKLLDEASSLLTPGGRIVYSTCSFSYEEDEAMVLDFLKEHPSFKPVLPLDHSSFYHHPDLPESIRLFPSHFEGEGQFMCLLVDTREKENASFHGKSKGLGIHSRLEKEFALEGRYNFLYGDVPYSLSLPLPLSARNILRPGVKLLDPSYPYVPDFALARFLDAKRGIALDEEQAKAYLQGLSFPLKEKEGVCLLTYMGLSLGFAKISKGTVKNHYPKGLRRRY